MVEADNLTWLMNWYLSQCNEDWEHQNGVRICTLDNPGWSLTIDLEGTSLAGKPFTPIRDNATEDNPVQGDVRWMVATVSRDKFNAYGGPRDLSRLIEGFRQWALAAPEAKP